MKKTIRYYYWLILEFAKKHLKYILLSFLLSLVCIIVLITLSPFVQTILFTNTQVVGIAGRYEVQDLPEDITTKISNGLIFINEKGELAPGIANSWKFDSQGRQYTFKIKNDLFWNDGREFSASDINYRFKDVQVKVIDSQTITFYLKNPLPIFPTYLNKPLFRYPLIGVAGLYHTEDLKLQDGYVRQLTLVPNKKGLSSITYKFYDDETLLTTAYKKGEIRQMQITKKNTADEFSTWKNSTVTKTVDYTRLMTLFFNMSNPLWRDAKDKEVRQIMRMAIDTKPFEAMGVEAIGSLSPLSWAYDDDLKRNVYDPETAAKNIKKLNIASQSAALVFKTSYDNFTVADSIAGSLEKAGIRTNLNFSPLTEQNTFDILLAYWKVPIDPDQYYFWHQKQKGKGNITGYDRPKIDKLLEDGRNITNITERKKIYHEFEKTLLDDPPAVFLFYPYIYTVKRK